MLTFQSCMTRKRIWITMLALLILFPLSACSSGAKSDEMSAAPPEMQVMEVRDQYGAANAAPDAGKAAMSNSVQTTAARDAAVFAGAGQPGSAAGTAEGAGIGPIADPQAGTARKVIYKASVSMNVPDFDEADQQLRDAIHLSGAYILQFSNTVDARGKGAAYVIKVPADGFSSFIERLREIHKDLQLQLEGSDVTEEYVDLNARLQAKLTAEQRLLSFMEKATGSDDLVRFANELAAVQEQIEQIKGRIRYLDQNVAYSTVNVRLHEGAPKSAKAGEADGFGQRLIDALTGSAKTLGQFGQALLIFLAAMLPVAAVAAAIGVPVYFIARAGRRARREAAERGRKQGNGGVPVPADRQMPDLPPDARREDRPESTAAEKNVDDH